MVSPKKTRQAGQVQSVHRALTILNAVARHPEGIGVRELARQVGLKAPTAHALVKTVEQMTYVEHCPSSRKYRLGLGAVMLGFGAGTGWNTRIAGTVRDLLEKLGEELDETAFVFGFINGLVVCLDVVDRPHELSVRMRPGIFIQEPHFLANGKVLLSNAPSGVRQDYAKQKEATDSLGEEYRSAEELLADFDRIRKAGFAEVENIRNSGVYGAAVPVHGFFGANDISVGASLPTARANPPRKKEIIIELTKTAKTMSRRISGLAERMRG